MTMRAAVLLSTLALLAAGCTSTAPVRDESILSPASAQAQAPETVNSAAAEQKITELQNTISELLERLDVMNDRMTRLEGAPAPAAVSHVARPAETPVSVTAEPPVSTAAAAPAAAIVDNGGHGNAVAGAAIADKYRNALTLYGRGRVTDARKAFQDVFDSDPAGELADNALYWLGETYFAVADYSSALKYYERVAREYGDQNKAPDAMYKIGLVQVKRGDLQLAKQSFEECIRKYPYSTPASSAKMELKRIKY